MLKTVGFVLVALVLSPIILVCSLLFMVIWIVFTITGLGPLLQWHYTQKDKNLLNIEMLLGKHPDLRMVTVPAGINSATGGKPYRMCIRYTEPSVKDNGKPPIVVPNGLGATLALGSRMHESLVDRGYRVLSFDRLGVGFSDPNPTGNSPSGADLCREMDFAMRSVGLPPTIKWLCIGPSMGAIVAQAYLALFPDRFCGFLNLDGLPAPFIRATKAFKFFGQIYVMYTYVIWTGIFRPFIALAEGFIIKAFGNRTFSTELLLAQMNRTEFFGNIGVEMITMMSCCELATAAWGDVSPLKLDPKTLTGLASTRPARSVIVDEREGVAREVTEERSEAELGGDWCSAGVAEEARSQVVKLAAGKGSGGNYGSTANEEMRLPSAAVADLDTPLSDLKTFAVGGRLGGVSTTDAVHPLAPQWRPVVCRVMHMRTYMGGNSQDSQLYKQEWRNWSAAEGMVMVYLSSDGERIVYPRLDHGAGEWG